MRIAIGTDHRGVGVKQGLSQWLQQSGHEVSDHGAQQGEESVDYPDIAAPVAESVAAGSADRGILICGTGIGMAIAANKVPGVRAHAIRTIDEARISRQHNDLNVLCLPGDLSEDELQPLIKVFLETDFEGGRHARRTGKIAYLENRFKP